MDNKQLEINRVRLMVRDATDKVSRLEKELDEIVNSLESRQKDLLQYQSDGATLPGKIKKEKDNLSSVKIAFVAAVASHNVINNIWIQQGRKLPKPVNLQKAEAELAAKKKEHDALEKKVAALENQLNQIPALKQKAADEIKKLEKDKSAIEANLNAAKADLAKVEAEYRQLNEAQKKLLSEVLGAMPESDLPVALLPVHLQTRYRMDGNQPELLIRIYPDILFVDTHEPELTEAEWNYGRNYWDRIWRIGKGQDDTAVLPRQNAWAQLCQRFTPRRAAWIVKTLTPLNPGAEPMEAIAENLPLPKPIQFPNPEKRASSWTRAPKIKYSPYRWVASAYRGGDRVLLAWGEPVPDGLHIGPDPQAPPPAPGKLSPDQLAIDEGMRWIIDFEEAEKKGMGIRVQLTPEEAKQPFDILMVHGIANNIGAAEASKILGELLDAHHYTNGLEFIRQGTPTNNMEDTGSGFSTDDPGFIRSFDTECKAPLFKPGESCHASALAEALGFSPSVFYHVQNGQGKEQQEARSMRTALWPVTWGYFLEQMMGNDQITPETVRQVRRHYIDFVSGGGLLPALRIGKQPYGILPVTALGRWNPEAASELPAHLIKLMQDQQGKDPDALSLRQIWRNALLKVPKASSEEAGGQGLLDIFSMNAVSRQFAAKSLIELAAMQDPEIPPGQKPPVLQMQELTEHLKHAERLLDRLGIDGQHRLLETAISLATLSQNAPIASAGPEEEPLDPDYIKWLRSADIPSLIAELGIASDGHKPNALIYLLLRHAALLAYSNAIFRKLMLEGKVKWENRLEPTKIKDGAVKTLGRYLQDNSQLLKQLDDPAFADLRDFLDSLQGLENLPSARLKDLFRETVDLSSHRLDAWITSLTSRRLSEIRKKRATGILLGAFGWVENLAPAPLPLLVDAPVPGESGSPIYASSEKGGFIHAPSLDHAATAAIMRSGYLSQNKDRNSDQFAIDLSSERARLAQGLLEGVRQGQSLSALLGYRFERGLHQRRLDQFIESFRLLAPLGPLYKLMAEVETAQQRVATLEKWKSPELKAAEEGFRKFSETKSQFEKADKELYDYKLLRSDFNEIFRELFIVEGMISMLNKLYVEGISEKEKENLDREKARLNAIKKKWSDQLKSKIDALNVRAKDYKNLHNGLVDYFYRYPDNKTGAIKVKVNYSGPNSIPKLNWSHPLIAKEESPAVKNAIIKISGDQPMALRNRMPVVIKEFNLYIKDLTGKAHPDLSSAVEHLEELRAMLEQARQSYNEQYLLPPGSGIESIETISAQKVVDGLALLRLWREHMKKPVIPFGGQVGTKKIQLPISGEQYIGLVAELNALADAVDAVGDALLSESVYQTVKGNAIKAGASVDAIARGELPPADLEFLKSPRSGITLTHRFFLLLPEKQANPGWPTATNQVRAKIEPVLNAWVGQLLGNPDQILIQAEYQHPESKVVLSSRVVLLSELNLSPLDFFYLSNREPVPLHSELEQRITYHLLRTRPQDIASGANIQLFFERGGDWLPTQFSLAEMLEAARAIREIIAKGSPLQPAHLGLQGDPNQAGLDLDELQSRVNTAIDRFKNAHNKLSQLLQNVEQTILEEFRAALMVFSSFGVPGAIPLSATGNTPEDRRLLVDQSRAILAEAGDRWAKAQELLAVAQKASPNQKLESLSNCLQTLLHPDFQLLPLFRVQESGDAIQSFKQSDNLQDGDPFAVCSWVERISRVREEVGRMNEAIVYAQALRQNYENHYKVGQLPYQQGDRWAALTFPEGKEILPGSVSLVGFTPWGIDATARQTGLLIDEWTEIIPRQKQMTGLAFQSESPGARAPQSILLAVSPQGTAQWDIEMIENILLETNELCKLRAVDLEALSLLGEEENVSQFLPAIYLSLNQEGDTISTDPLRAFLLPKIE